MVGLLIDLKPIKIKKLQEELQRERDIANAKMKISKKLKSQIQKDPIKSKFQID